MRQLSSGALKHCRSMWMLARRWDTLPGDGSQKLTCPALLNGRSTVGQDQQSGLQAQHVQQRPVAHILFLQVLPCLGTVALGAHELPQKSIKTLLLLLCLPPRCCCACGARAACCAQSAEAGILQANSIGQGSNRHDFHVCPTRPQSEHAGKLCARGTS